MGVDLSKYKNDPSRVAAAEAALAYIEPGMTISLGSGRAVFLLAEAIGKRWPGAVPIRSVVASSLTEAAAKAAGIPTLTFSADIKIDLTLDGADEVDTELHLIKGGGAALLQEKLVIAHAERVMILAQASKYSQRIGNQSRLPIEIVRFGWDTTLDRIRQLTPDAELRTADGNPVITDEGHYLVDSSVPEGDLHELAQAIKGTLGVVEHGLFLDETDDLILGNDDGSIQLLRRAE